MNTNIVPLRPEIDPKTIRVLEEALADARAGKIKGIGVIYVEDNGTISTYLSNSVKRYNMVYGLARLSHRIMTQIDEETR